MALVFLFFFLPFLFVLGALKRDYIMMILMHLGGYL
jgi:hypothetical protein